MKDSGDNIVEMYSNFPDDIKIKTIKEYLGTLKEQGVPQEIWYKFKLPCGVTWEWYEERAKDFSRITNPS